MPELISVEEFIAETLEDYSSPTTSSFTKKMTSCRNSVNIIEEVWSKTKKNLLYKEAAQLNRFFSGPASLGVL